MNRRLRYERLPVLLLVVIMGGLFATVVWQHNTIEVLEGDNMELQIQIDVYEADARGYKEQIQKLVADLDKANSKLKLKEVEKKKAEERLEKLVQQEQTETILNAPDFVYGQFGRILAMVTEVNKELTAGQVLEIAQHTVRMGLMYDVDPVLIASVMRVESNYRPTAVGSSGEIGLMQILPKTAEWISNQLGEEFSKDELYSVSTNIRYGTWYLSYLLGQAEDYGFVGEDRTRYALLCYNRGIGSVRRAVSRGSNPSNGYDKRVLDIVNRYR